MLGTFWLGELEQQTGIEPPEYLQRFCLGGRYSTGKCRGCRKDPEIRESKTGGKQKGGSQISVQKFLLN